MAASWGSVQASAGKDHLSPESGNRHPRSLRSGVDTSYLEQQEGRGHGVQRLEEVCSTGTVEWEPVRGHDELHKNTPLSHNQQHHVDMSYLHCNLMF